MLFDYVYIILRTCVFVKCFTSHCSNYFVLFLRTYKLCGMSLRYQIEDIEKDKE